MSLTFKDSLMFYNTSFRNVGLYTSISVGLLGVSRFYRVKGNALYNKAFILLSLIAILLAVVTLQNLIKQLTQFNSQLKGDEQKILEAWVSVSKGAQLLVYPILGFALFTLYRESVKSNPV